MAFHVGGLVGNHRITYCMGLIEGIICKIHDFIKDGFRGLFIYTPFDGTINAQFFIAINEVGAFLCQLLHLLFGHGTPYHIRLAQGIARQHTEYFHDLFLIDHTAIGNIQNVLEQRVLILYERWVMLACDISWNRLHRTRTI